MGQEILPFLIEVPEAELADLRRPLILTHAWPGSVVEFGKVIGPLSDPDDGCDAFHVVCPSLPGYGFSGKPGQAGWGVERIARAWAEKRFTDIRYWG